MIHICIGQYLDSATAVPLWLQPGFLRPLIQCSRWTVCFCIYRSMGNVQLKRSYSVAQRVLAQHCSSRSLVRHLLFVATNCVLHLRQLDIVVCHQRDPKGSHGSVTTWGLRWDSYPCVSYYAFVKNCDCLLFYFVSLSDAQEALCRWSILSSLRFLRIVVHASWSGGLVYILCSCSLHMITCALRIIYS